MGNLTLERFLQNLNPISNDPFNLIWGISLYLVFFLCLIMLFRQRRPQIPVQLFLVGAMMLAIVDKVATGNVPGALFRNNELITLFLRVGVFSLPLLAVAVTKTEKSRIWGILAVGIGIVYVLLRGVLEMGWFGSVETPGRR
ncbi:MAG: hypothetical protein CUN51_03310 [Candidatus Thermofonsia Clade 1 bacterium]|jgi:hypothetical protein|uniref:Uncharacterized protein n=1 Tax=Candidatus Thermofonsia Clade 1 bacterium TaxID=2364210 RepID=A0A2M8P1E7_9CHLR|nr:MAG: hypothetical protein CUN51_03310 [Candidatus Thermofonsia Clade 1 bacterium]